jgi:hypothetical protein
MPVEPKDSTSNNPPTGNPTQEPPIPNNNLPLDPSQIDLLSHLMDHMDQLECKLSKMTTTTNTHPPQPKRTPAEPPSDNPQPPPPHPQANNPMPPQNTWVTVPSKCKPTGRKKPSNTSSPTTMDANTSSNPQPESASLHTQVTLLQEKDPQVGKEGCHDPLAVTQQIRASLRAFKSPLILLSGHWSTVSNFTLTFAGSIPFSDILKEAEMLMQPFPGATLVLSVGLSKVTFNRVPTRDPDVNEFFTAQQLLSKVKQNPLCTDLQFMLQPCWMWPTQPEMGPFSSISFTFLDPDGSIMQAMSRSHLAMFGKAITFKKWLVRPPILQYPHCHKLGHLGTCYQLSKDVLCCHLCSGNH